MLAISQSPAYSARHQAKYLALESQLKCQLYR